MLSWWKEKARLLLKIKPNSNFQRLRTDPRAGIGLLQHSVYGHRAFDDFAPDEILL